MKELYRGTDCETIKCVDIVLCGVANARAVCAKCEYVEAKETFKTIQSILQ